MECLSCGSEVSEDKCPKSHKSCGHHCDHSWTHDSCCWCGKHFDSEELVKVLFLDVDGVLNSNGTIRTFGFDFIDPHLVDLVGIIVDQTDAKIVLSSTWRKDPTDKKLVEDALARAGLSLMDCTPDLCEDRWVLRNEEIKKWLSENPVDKFAILDDFEDAEIPGSFFKTDDDVGLTKAITLEVIKHLNS